MTFPEAKGKALTMAGFEELIWNHPQFANGETKPSGTVKDVSAFIKWHLQSAQPHNYTVGTVLLIKQNSLWSAI